MQSPSLSKTTTELPIQLSDKANVCDGCRSSLLHVFYHCLTRDNSSFPNVLLQTELDSKQVKSDSLNIEKLKQVELPPDKLYRDIPTTKMFPNGKLARPKSSYEPRRRVLKHQTSKSGDESEDEDDEPDVFGYFPASIGSNTLRKKISLQNNEIDALRSHIVEYQQKEKEWKMKETQMDIALKKAIYYTMNAKEWQKRESADLKLVIEEFKVDFGALMAFVLVGEEDKQNLGVLLNNERHKNETLIRENQMITEEIRNVKRKLKASFEDYKYLNSKFVEMETEKDAKSKSQCSEVEFLKSKLSQLSMDYNMLRIKFDHLKENRKD